MKTHYVITHELYLGTTIFSMSALTTLKNEKTVSVESWREGENTATVVSYFYFSPMKFPYENVFQIDATIHNCTTKMHRYSAYCFVLHK